MERITADTTGPSRDGHECRYYLASGFLWPGCVVLDAACGGGYGAPILRSNNNIAYYGVDKDLSGTWVLEEPFQYFIETDLTIWQPDFTFDVFVGFETIEHLDNYSNYIRIAKQASSWIIVSAPIVPTKHVNPWHLHDFEPGELASIFEDNNWRLFQTVGQPSELSEISIFKRKL